jgi:hypothetical protein
MLSERAILPSLLVSVVVETFGLNLPVPVACEPWTPFALRLTL